ncbi:MAG: DUF488 domain-containing protein [Ruminiclostridium sp.]|nr:DUF488 domain-containing protein [Ruminiclostridium sp.]
MENTSFTIGHSTQAVDDFVKLLKKHKIKYLIDIRSTPYSKFASQFNSENLKLALKTYDIIYGYMGNELGARYKDPSLLFPDGRVDFKKVRSTDNFKKGIERVVQGAVQGFRIALMCSEKDPFECHRFCLVSYALAEQGLKVLHILQDGSLIANEALEDRLLDKYRQDYNQVSLLEPLKPRMAFLEESYVEHNNRIGYLFEEEEDYK